MKFPAWVKLTETPVCYARKTSLITRKVIFVGVLQTLSQKLIIGLQLIESKGNVSDKVD
jgi:hypothetical protein